VVPVMSAVSRLLMVTSPLPSTSIWRPFVPVMVPLPSLVIVTFPETPSMKTPKPPVSPFAVPLPVMSPSLLSVKLEVASRTMIPVSATTMSLLAPMLMVPLVTVRISTASESAPLRVKSPLRFKVTSPPSVSRMPVRALSASLKVAAASMVRLPFSVPAFVSIFSRSTLSLVLVKADVPSRVMEKGETEGATVCSVCAPLQVNTCPAVTVVHAASASFGPIWMRPAASTAVVESSNPRMRFRVSVEVAMVRVPSFSNSIQNRFSTSAARVGEVGAAETRKG